MKTHHLIDIHLVHFPLHPETPIEGATLEKLFPGRDLTPMKENMKKLMREAGLDYGERTHTFNSRLAQELGKWADAQNGESDIHNLIYRAYFVEGKNISDVNELLRIAEKAGFDKRAAKEVLEKRSFKSLVGADWQESREFGVTGVPTFQYNQNLLVGCQPYEMLERFIDRHTNS